MCDRPSCGAGSLGFASVSSRFRQLSRTFEELRTNVFETHDTLACLTPGFNAGPDACLTYVP